METQKLKETTLENKYLNSLLDDEEQESNYVYYKNTFIYGWGKNKYGELGLGHTENALTPSPIKSLQNMEVSQVCSGGKHSVIVTSDGRVLVCGTDVLGLLGFENRKWKEQHKFQRMVSLDSEVISNVSCAEFHSLCLAREGYLFTWGGNLHNKLGQVNQGGIPMKLNALLSRKIVSISCGDYHSLALADTGEVFSWGGGGQYNRGQCGHGDLKDQDTPKRIDFFKGKKVAKVVCGGYHTIALTEENKLYGFGKGEYGQLGYGSSEDASLPKLIKFGNKSLQYERVLVKNDITDNLTLTNAEETMVNNTLITNNYTPIIKDIKCGGEHSVLLTSFGRVYTFGHGYTGQLGLGNTKNFERPMIVKSMLKKTVNQIAAGWSHTMVLTSEGNIYVTGGLNETENKKNFTLLRHASLLNVTNIYAGGHHSWLVTDAITPERNDFESPSPLGVDNFSPTFQKSNENSPRNVKNNASSSVLNKDNQVTSKKPVPTKVKKPNSSLKFNLDLLGEKLAKEDTKTVLHVAYTDLKLSHRFVRFTIAKNSKLKDVSNKDLNAMFREFLTTDPGIVIYRLQDDKDVNFSNLTPSLEIMLKDFKSDLKFLDMNFDKRSYSLTVLYDPNKNEKMKELRSSIETIKKQNNILTAKTVKTIYEVVNITEDEIKTSQIEEIMSSWVNEFKNNFTNLFEEESENLRFIELRPNCYYI